MTPDNGDKELVPLNGKHLPYGFPDSVVKQALIYCRESESVALGWRRLKAELELGGMIVPDYHTVWQWARADEECYTAVTGSKKREYVSMCADVTELTTERLIKALPGLSDSQMPIVWGIAEDKLQGWHKVGQPGTVIPIQLNVSAGGQAEANPWSKDKD